MRLHTNKHMSKNFICKSQEKREIEIVSDNGSTLDISNVSDAIIGKKEDKPKNIVIPKGKK